MEKWKKYWPLAVVVSVIVFLSWISWASAAHITHPGQCVTPAMTDELVKAGNPQANFEGEITVMVVEGLAKEIGLELGDVLRVYGDSADKSPRLVVIYRGGCEVAHGMLNLAEANELLGRKA